MPTRLSGMDAAFLHLETPTAHMHVGSTIVLDPSTAPDGTLTTEQVKEHLGARLHLAPPFRRRLKTVPLRLAPPVWIEDPDFDLDDHVVSVTLPDPGGTDELGEVVGDMMSQPLDRRRPLWEVWVISGLEGGRVALATKTHHAAIDGVSGVELLAAVLQPADAPPPPPDSWTAEEEPTDAQLLRDAGAYLAGQPRKALAMARRLSESAVDLTWLRRRGIPAPPPPFAAPRTVFNGAIGPHRQVGFAEVPLADVKEVKAELGSSVNDVVLAAVAGAVRTYLADRGEAVDAPLVGMVPVAVRSTEGGRDVNNVTPMLVGLPVDLEDPLERVRSVARGSTDAKKHLAALGPSTVQEAADLALPGVFAAASQLYTRVRAADHHRPIWNLVVSNIPGPPMPLYCAGAKLEAVYPMGPVHEMAGLNITMFSYRDTVFVGVNADRAMLPDAGRLASGLQDAVDDLVKSVREASEALPEPSAAEPDA